MLYRIPKEKHTMQEGVFSVIWVTLSERNAWREKEDELKKKLQLVFRVSISHTLFTNITNGITTRSYENEQNRSRVNTKPFCSSLDLPHKNEDTPVVQSDRKVVMLLFCY